MRRRQPELRRCSTQAKLPNGNCRLVMRMPQSSGPFTKVALTIVAVVLVVAVTWLKSHPGNSATHQTDQAAGIPRLSGSYDLGRDENMGGHTLHRHVGRTDEQLRERLNEEPDIAAASTYNDRAAAERTVAEALTQGRGRVEGWLDRTDAHPNLTLQFRGSASIGRSIRRGARTSEPCSEALVVLRWDGDRRFHVITTYPEAYHGR